MKAARQAVQYAAEQLGFSGLGVAPACADQGDMLSQWLRDGCHADMHWLEHHLPMRQNPALLLPGVRCVIMLTYEYPRLDARRGPGSIARYAQGEDYHKLLAPKLADLDETLQLYGGTQKCFSDSGPVSERFFAAAAGLGWLGRHGLLVRPHGGSFCFLSCILTTLPLPTDQPMPNRCGTCHRCEQACPTHALQDGRCDARRCLAYWTIESKQTSAPPEIQKAMHGHLYGCDACQEVCPWNGLSSPHDVDLHLLMPARLAAMPQETLADLPEEDWMHLIANSPMRRTGVAHLRRNIQTFANSFPS